jgi:hypothetical protein
MNTRKIKFSLGDIIKQNDIDYQNVIIDERHKEIQEIQKEMLQINEIFANAASLINEQSYEIDASIGNIAKAKTLVADGAEDLEQAERLQDSFCLMM